MIQMPYEVLLDGATIHKSVGEYRDNQGNFQGYQHLGKVYRKGEVLADEDVSPVLVEALENKDPHVLSLLKKVSDDPNVKGPGGEADVDYSTSSMGPETGSPGVVMPDKAAIVAEAQTAAGEGGAPLAAGVSPEAQAKLDEEGFVPSTASATYEPAASEQTPAEKAAEAKAAKAAAKAAKEDKAAG